MILARPKLEYTYADLDVSTSIIQNTADLYSTLLALAEQSAIVWLNKHPVYADELRPDYNNHQLYFPIYRYDEVSIDGLDIRVNNRLEKFILHSFDSGWLVDEIIIQPLPSMPKAYKLKLSKQKFERETKDSDLDARSLFSLYLASSYTYTVFDEDYSRYTPVTRRSLTKYQKKLIADSGLHFYGDYINLDYRDVRNWPLHQLSKNYSMEELQLDKPYSVRRIGFELELYTRLYTGILWTGWTDGNTKELLSNNREYLKYKENGVYLIFKRKWLRGIEP